jgi:hypothetical protein
MPGAGDGIVVLSTDFDLGWRSRSDGGPGSAVVFEDSSYEVVAREPLRRGARWTLEPWAGEDVMRVVLPLDKATVKTDAEAARMATRSAGLRPTLLLLSPLLGFAASSWQRRWRDEWGFPATLATWLSAILEMVLGAACVMELIASAGGGMSVFTWIPRPLVYIGLVLFVEGLVRLAQVASDSEPVGTLLGLVVLAFERREVPAPEPISAPEVQAFDEDEGTLELLSPILRRDWEGPGLLLYRGERFALDSTKKLGESWVYVFRGVEAADGGSGPPLRLLPPRSRMEGRSFTDQPGAVKTVLLTIACTLAPRRFQERWAWELGVWPRWFTVMGASAELIGGWSNLSAGTGAALLTVVLNLFFVFEAVVRFGSVTFRGQPLGSLLGLPLIPVLDRYLPEPGPLSDEPPND